MLYREYGSTGKKISIISAGGMRYDKPNDIDESAEVPLTAARLGINYFDTAPGYSEDKSEIILGHAVKQMKKEGLDFMVSTKCYDAGYDKMMVSIEQSLKRLNVESIDFMHSWGVNSFETLDERKIEGSIKALQEAKEQGLVKHVVCSSHMSGEDIATLTDTGLFEGVTLGFCAINFPFRMNGIKGAARNKMGVVTMNPLGGGFITDNPDRFDFIRTESNQSLLGAALAFNLSHSEITSALVGFRKVEDVRSAVAALENFKTMTDSQMSSLKDHIESGFDSLCTTCNYCRDCPSGINVAAFMESYNYWIVNKESSEVSSRLKWHWFIEGINMLSQCTECLQCVDICTQKLPIMERFAHLREMFEDN
jgi:predicted aldo/keto reductase-like oxidoreductase